MSRHNKQITPQRPGKKAAEREARIKAARQRMLFHTFTALALLIFDKWQHNEALQEDISSLPANERRYFKMMIPKCRRAVQAVVRMLHEETSWPTAPTGSFFIDASRTIKTLLNRVCVETPSMPETCRYMDVHAIITYIIYCAINDWLWTHQDTVVAHTEELADMLTNIKAFANHLIPADSPFITPLNDVFWATRDMLHAGAPVPEYSRLIA